jgi:hypothetical protein
MVWTQATMMPGRRRGEIRQTQCGKPEATPSFKKKQIFLNQEHPEGCRSIH